MKMSQLVTTPICLAFADESSTSSEYFGVGATIYFPESLEMEKKAYEVLRLEKKRCGLGLRGDVKWTKIPKKPGKYLDCYNYFINTFFESKKLRFCCMIVDTKQYQLDNKVFFKGMKDKGIDSFMYYLISRRILNMFRGKASNFTIRIDRRRRPESCDVKQMYKRLKGDLDYPDYGKPGIFIRQIEGGRHPIINITDLLLGATMAKWNGKTTSATKISMINDIESKLGYGLDKISSRFDDEKFNIWFFEPNKIV